MNIQDWFTLGLTGLISLQSKGLSSVSPNNTTQKFKGSAFELPKKSIKDFYIWEYNLYSVTGKINM